MSYVTSLYHVVFCTHERKPSLNLENSDTLYAVISAEITKQKSKALIINGIQDHVHILLSLSPEVALSDIMRNIKSKSSVWTKQCGLFPLFDGWSKEYGAFSLSATHKDAVYNYIKSQREHHLSCQYIDELERLVVKSGLTFYRW